MYSHPAEEELGLKEQKTSVPSNDLELKDVIKEGGEEDTEELNLDLAE